MMNTRGFGALRPRSTRTARRRAVAALTGTVTGLALTAASLVAPATANAVPAPTTTVATSAAMSAAALDTYETRVQRLINKRRVHHDLRRVRFARCANRVAAEWSRHLAAFDLFEHRSMTVVLDRCNARYAGETLGRGTMRPRKLVRMWMQSPGHRAILLSPKPRRIGVGAATDSSGRLVVTANFIRF